MHDILLCNVGKQSEFWYNLLYFDCMYYLQCMFMFLVYFFKLIFQCINLLNKLGLCVSSSAAAKKKTDFISEKIVLEQNTGDDKVLSDKIGDNRSPSHMSKDKQRQSWHWFLFVGLKRRVTNLDLIIYLFVVNIYFKKVLTRVGFINYHLF